MKITDTGDFGKTIRERRKRLGYTQVYLADVTGMSVSFISDLENGKQTCELGKAIYIMNLLGLDCNITERGSV
jgi:Predicted transcriptional regulators